MDNKNPTTSTKIDDLDLAKFQLLSAYLGMRTLEVEGVEKELELAKCKLELAKSKQDDARQEVIRYQRWLYSQYDLTPTCRVNYADGTIERSGGTIEEEVNPNDSKTEKEEAQA